MKNWLGILTLLIVVGCGSDSTDNEETTTGTVINSGLANVKLTQYGESFKSIPNSRISLTGEGVRSLTFSNGNVDGRVASTSQEGPKFFQNIPTAQLVGVRGPDANWLNIDELLRGAKDGYNYVILDNDTDGDFEMVILLYLNSTDPAASYIAGVAEHELGEALSLTTIQAILDLTKPRS